MGERRGVSPPVERPSPAGSRRNGRAARRQPAGGASLTGGLTPQWASGAASARRWSVPHRRAHAAPLAKEGKSPINFPLAFYMYKKDSRQHFRACPGGWLMDDGELVRQVLAGNTDAYADLALRWAGR